MNLTIKAPDFEVVPQRHLISVQLQDRPAQPEPTGNLGITEAFNP